MAVILLGLAGISNVYINTQDRLSKSHFTLSVPPIERSVESVDNVNSDILIYMDEITSNLNQGNFYNVINICDKALLCIDNEYYTSVLHFYKGESFQKIDKINEAISEYNKVINEGDNLYVSEAEFKKSLCYVKLGNKKLATRQLEAIIDKNGFYKKDAKVVLMKLRFSVR